MNEEFSNILYALKTNKPISSTTPEKNRKPFFVKETRSAPTIFDCFDQSSPRKRIEQDDDLDLLSKAVRFLFDLFD